MRASICVLSISLGVSGCYYGATSYEVVVNGVTGTIAGSRPYSWIKVTLLVIAALILFLLWASSRSS